MFFIEIFSIHTDDVLQIKKKFGKPKTFRSVKTWYNKCGNMFKIYEIRTHINRITSVCNMVSWGTGSHLVTWSPVDYICPKIVINIPWNLKVQIASRCSIKAAKKVRGTFRNQDLGAIWRIEVPLLMSRGNPRRGIPEADDLQQIILQCCTLKGSKTIFCQLIITEGVFVQWWGGRGWFIPPNDHPGSANWTSNVRYVCALESIDEVSHWRCQLWGTGARAVA